MISTNTTTIHAPIIRGFNPATSIPRAAYFGQGGLVVTIACVPEPGAALLGSLGALAMFVRRHR